MKQRYRELTDDLCWQAVDACFIHKWHRSDVLAYIEEYAGIPRREIYADELNGAVNSHNEACDNIAGHLMDMIEEIMDGGEPEIAPVSIRKRPDGMTGKLRDIACLHIDHQLLGHAVVLGLMPLFKARILPQQHASLPGRGQTKLKSQVKRYLRMKSLNIQVAKKTDVVQAYASLLYARITEIIEKEIPSAMWIVSALKFLEKLAPGGHLIIGGYLDAWLFNLAMSYAMRYLLSIGQERRGKFTPYVSRVISYMDDFCIMARTQSGLEKAVKKLMRWFEKNLGLSIKITTGVIRLLNMKEEQARKHLPKPSQRGCPNIDMAGYRISRTHISMRGRVAKRAIRAFARAWEELQTTGTMSRRRAGSVMAYNGFVTQTDSEHFRVKYHVEEIKNMANKIKAYWSRYDRRKRKEWLKNVVSKDAVECYARWGDNRAVA